MVFVGSLAYITPLAVAPDEAVDINNYEVVTGISQDDYVLVASPQTGFKTVKDIVDAKRPIKYATTGVGTGSQLSQELLFAQADIERHRGAVQRRRARADRGARRPGRRRLRPARRGAGPDQGQARSTPIVTFAEKRPTYMPDTPTAIEAGYNAPVQQSRAIVAPKGTPQEVLDRLRAAFQKAFADAGVQGLQHPAPAHPERGRRRRRCCSSGPGPWRPTASSSSSTRSILSGKS